MRQKLEAHPCFEPLSEQELAADPAVALLTRATEEGQKVARNSGQVRVALWLVLAAVLEHLGERLCFCRPGGLCSEGSLHHNRLSSSWQRCTVPSHLACSDLCASAVQQHRTRLSILLVACCPNLFWLYNKDPPATFQTTRVSTTRPSPLGPAAAVSDILRCKNGPMVRDCLFWDGMHGVACMERRGEEG